jgi:serine phosphatase RsbU (regulator of sigma subunit)
VAFQHTDKVKFQWKLEGIDNNWTPPIQKNEAVYPNLPAGNYTFRVKSGIEEQNIWSNEAIYSFRISPPWWKTWWFIGACVFAVSLLVYSFVRIRLKAIKAQQVELERLVLEKTAEIRQQNTEILAQAETLQQANSQIMRQAELLTQKNKDITASINYAKRIQTAMLPNESDIRAVLPNSFILFKPKDIVSGDFYYFAEIKEEGASSNLQSKVILAAIDCTGHGVPGAFMSMIGNDLLNHIVLEKGMLRPNMILEELHKGVRKSLKQAENKVRDGMDLSLILIDKAQESIEFSGAMNPLYYVQNGVFHEIKGDKKPIGGFQDHDVAYRTHLISIAEPTTIYLCSDGYQDQFSPEGKKFMVRKFKELLFAIQENGMEEQKNLLTEKINLWVGDTKQIDDILVIGVRF